MVQDYVTLALLWTGYFSVHSILASTTIKEKLIEKLTINKKTYRIIYNIISIIGLIAIMLFITRIESNALFTRANWQKYFGLVFASWGIIIIKLSFKNYSLKEFLGFVESHVEEFQTAGILRYVRHPIYTGTLLIIAGFFIFLPTASNLITCCCFLIYIFIGIQFEEQKLISEFGDKYRDYKKQVAMLIPYIL